MSTEPKNKWRLLHELCLKVKEAKDFETLGAVVEELSELKTAERNAAKFGNGQYFEAVSNAYIAAWQKLGQWQENPPPIAPQETQIGPGNPFPIPPPPPPPTVAAPTPQAPGSLDELRKTVVCAITSTSEKDVVFGKWGGADVGLLLSALVRMVDKAFADHAAQNAKAIERAAAPVKTPEPWTGESLYLAADMQLMEAPGDWTTLTSFQQKLWMLAASAANERMGSAPSPLKPWTAEQFYLQFGPPDYRLGILTSVRLGTAQREACEKAAAVINKWAGLAS